MLDSKGIEGLSFFKERRGMKFGQIHAVQELLQFESVLDSGIIKMKDSSYIMLIDVKPINYNLKSELEKSNILNSYKLLFQNVNFNLQVLIQSKPEDLKEHLSMIRSINSYPKLTEKYIDFINSIREDKKSSAKYFFIIIKTTNLEELSNNYLKISEGLSRCGNIVSKLTKEKTQKVLKSFIKEKG